MILLITGIFSKFNKCAFAECLLWARGSVLDINQVVIGPLQQSFPDSSKGTHVDKQLQSLTGAALHQVFFMVLFTLLLLTRSSYWMCALDLVSQWQWSALVKRMGSTALWLGLVPSSINTCINLDKLLNLSVISGSL